MKSNIVSIMFAAMSFSDIWAVYGVGLPVQEPETIELEDFKTTPNAATSTDPTHTTIFATPVLATLQPSAESSPSSIPATATASSTPTPIPSETSLPHATPLLSNAAVLGISIASVVILLATLFLLFGLPYFRRLRRGRALQRAIDEVERGIEMRKTGVSEVGESKENMVLESQVEIFVHEGDERERDLVDMVGRWDGWDANGDAEEEMEEWERGRKGMSLPRREW